jgi:hypothetical protein
MQFILEKLREDFANNNTELWVYDSVDALMALLQQNSGLNLPADLSRLRIEESLDFEEAKTFLIVSVDLTRASKAVAAYQKLKGQKLLFFLDEFAPNPEQDMLAFFRRNLLNLGACVVVASTDSVAANMLNPKAGTSASATGSWVHVCNRLPTFVSHPKVTCSIEALDDGLKELFKFCLRAVLDLLC